MEKLQFVFGISRIRRDEADEKASDESGQPPQEHLDRNGYFWSKELLVLTHLTKTSLVGGHVRMISQWQHNLCGWCLYDYSLASILDTCEWGWYKKDSKQANNSDDFYYRVPRLILFPDVRLSSSKDAQLEIYGKPQSTIAYRESFFIVFIDWIILFNLKKSLFSLYTFSLYISYEFFVIARAT